MFDIEMTKISSKGQMVIPKEMRKGFKVGEKLVVIKSGNQLIIKKASDLDKNLKEDLIFAKQTEKQYKKYLKGGFKKMEAKEFLEEIKKW